MTADDRAPRSGQTFTPPAFEPTTDEVPVTSGAPTTGQTPTRASLRPTTGQQPAGSQPTTGSQPTGPTRTQPRAFAPVSGAVPTDQRPATSAPAQQRPAQRPATEPAAPRPASGQPVESTARPANESEASAPAEGGFSAVLGTGVDKLKLYGGKAKRSLTEGNDITVGKGAPRRARVLVSRIDPWSVLKIGFLLSIAIGIMTVVAVYVVWHVLNGMGFFTLTTDWIMQLFTEPQNINLEQFFQLDKWMSAAILISVVNVVLLTALSAIGAFLYNAVSSVVGGVYVTLTDD